MNTACCDNLSTLLESAYALIAYRDLIEKWLHGTENETVTLGGVAVPTLRRLIALIDERESQAAEEAINEGVQNVVLIKTKLEALFNDWKDRFDALTEMTASAHSLEAGATPTAEYLPDSGELRLGIPRGERGAIGPAGPPGQAPVIDVIDCGGAYGERVTLIDGGNALTTEWI